MFKNTNKIRIIVFLPNFTLGGAAESLVKLIRFLPKKKFSILIISLGKNSYKKMLLKMGCDIIEINYKKTFFSIISLRRIFKNEINKKYKKTILLSNIHYANIVSILSTLFLKNIKIILTERSSLSELHLTNNFYKIIKNKIIFYLVKIFYRYADLIIANSNFEKKYIKKNIKINKIITIHPPSLKKIFILNKSKQSSKVLKIIYVGRLSKEKGILTILKALKIIKNKLKFNFKVYGDGNEKKIVQTKIKLYKIEKVVKLFGHQKNHNKIFKNADLFINASLFEGLPNALVQALNFNVSVICSRSPGGNMEVVKNGKYGQIFSVNSENDLANKIMDLNSNRLFFNKNEKNLHLKKFTEKFSNRKYQVTLSKI